MTATPHALIHISSPVRGVLFCMFTRCSLLSFLSPPPPPPLLPLCPLQTPTPNPHPCNLVFTPSSSRFFFLLPSDIRVICWQMAAPGCATTTGGVFWIRTCGTAFASQDGEAWAATWPPKCSAPMARITREVGRRQRLCTNSLLTGARISDCAKLALMWPLGDGANKQNKSRMHKTWLESGNAAAEESVQQHTLKYTLDHLWRVVKTERRSANKLLPGPKSEPGTLTVKSRWQTFGRVPAFLSSRNLCCRFNELGWHPESSAQHKNGDVHASP